MTKKIYTLEKGWHEEEPNLSVKDALVNATHASLAPIAALVDTDNEPDSFKLPFKRVLNSHLIIKIDKFKYKGKVGIPDSARRKPTTGVVLAKDVNITDIEVGDRILYSQFAGYLLKFQGVPFLRNIGYNEVLAVLNDDAPEIESEGA